jgi:hypothetical protein
MARPLKLLKTRVQNEPGISKIKRIEFEGFREPVRMGVHGGFSEFFGIEPDEPLPSTLDYVVAAVSGCLTGTLSAALQRRGVPHSRSKSNVIRADAYQNRIFKVDLQGNIQGAYGETGRQLGQFLNSHGLSCDAQQNLYVAETRNRRVQKLMPK